MTRTRGSALATRASVPIQSMIRSDPVDLRIICIASWAGLFGQVGVTVTVVPKAA